jgi:hypothetical protein
LDLDLVVVLQLMLAEIESEPTSYRPLSDFVHLWRDNICNSGPGTIDLHLEELLYEPHGSAALDQLLRNVEQTILSLGDPIAGDMLNADFRVPGVQFHDCRSGRLHSALAKLRLVAGLSDVGVAE